MWLSDSSRLLCNLPPAFYCSLLPREIKEVIVSVARSVLVCLSVLHKAEGKQWTFVSCLAWPRSLLFMLSWRIQPNLGSGVSRTQICKHENENQDVLYFSFLFKPFIYIGLTATPEESCDTQGVGLAPLWFLIVECL